MKITTSKEIRFEVSTRCNYACKFCPHAHLLRRPKEVMSNKLFVDILQKVQAETGNQFRVLTFSGIGEPLMDPEIVYKVGVVYASVPNIILVTNASLLTVDLFKRLQDAGLGLLRVSFHGNSAREYCEYHKADPRILWDVLTTLEAIFMMNNRQTKVGINIVVDRDMEGEDIELQKLTWRRADFLEIWRPHNWGAAFDFRYKQPLPGRENCGRLERGPVQVQVDGTITSCCFDYNGNMAFGSLANSSLADCYERARYYGFCQFCDQLHSRIGALIYTSLGVADRTERTSTGLEKI